MGEPPIKIPCKTPLFQKRQDFFLKHASGVGFADAGDDLLPDFDADAIVGALAKAKGGLEFDFLRQMASLHLFAEGFYDIIGTLEVARRTNTNG
jgi:hypothetical protein